MHWFSKRGRKLTLWNLIIQEEKDVKCEKIPKRIDERIYSTIKNRDRWRKQVMKSYFNILYFCNFTNFNLFLFVRFFKINEFKNII